MQWCYYRNINSLSQGKPGCQPQHSSCTPSIPQPFQHRMSSAGHLQPLQHSSSKSAHAKTRPAPETHTHTWTKIQRCTKHSFKDSRIKRDNQTLAELVLRPSSPAISQEANFRAQLSTKQSHYDVLESIKPKPQQDNEAVWIGST